MKGKKIFYTDKAPEPVGPYSQAVIHNGTLYISGQVPINPVTGSLFRGTIEEETELALSNLRAIIEEAGAEIEDVLRVTCYLADLDDFPRFNDVYKRFFVNEPPARSTLQAGKLPLEVQVEMDAIVALPESQEL